MDAQLCDTPVTGRQLEELMINSKQLHINGHRLQDVDASLLSAGQGFTSKVLRIKLKWSDPNADLPKSIIVKVIGSARLDEIFQNFTKEELERMKSSLRQSHNVECEVYALCGLKSAVPMARCYASQFSCTEKTGIIILEDMTDRGQTIPFTFWGLGYAPGQLDSLLQTLANLHAWSVNHTEWRKTIPPLKEFNALQQVFDGLMAAPAATIQAYPDEFKNVDIEKLKQNINNEKFLDIFGCDPMARYNLPLVLVHGDVQYMNTLYEREPGQEISDQLLAMLDWQISHQGCAMEDLSRILVLCSSAKTERGNVEKMIRRYVELYNSKVDNVENQVTYENCQHALDEMFAFLGVMWPMGLSVLVSFADNMNFTPEEKQTVTDRIIDYYASMYQDAMKLVKW